MKLLYDFFPILAFFIAFKLGNIFWATGVFIIATIIQMLLQWFWVRRLETTHWLTFGFGILLGGATLAFHNEMFIKWKPTVIYWILGLFFLITQFFSKKTLIQRMLETNLKLPLWLWTRLNLSWAAFFIVMGFVNLFVVYHFSTDTWVNFKLFGMLLLTILFIIIQMVFLSHYIKTGTPHETS